MSNPQDHQRGLQRPRGRPTTGRRVAHDGGVYSSERPSGVVASGTGAVAGEAGVAEPAAAAPSVDSEGGHEQRQRPRRLRLQVQYGIEKFHIKAQLMRECVLYVLLMYYCRAL